MNLIEKGRYPHPIIEPDGGDFTEGEFDIEFKLSENPRSGEAWLEYEVMLTNRELRGLVEGRQVVVGCLIACPDTYHTALAELSWPRGRLDLAHGGFANRVRLHPLMWCPAGVSDWRPSTVNAEFPAPIDMAPGAVMGRGWEKIISIGHAKLAALETLFELARSEQLAEGTIEVDLDTDRITILASPDVFDAIALMREQQNSKPLLLMSVYLSAVMETLMAIGGNKSDYAERRWFAPFQAKCDVKGIDMKSNDNALRNAQRLLEFPFSSLRPLVDGAGGHD